MKSPVIERLKRPLAYQKGHDHLFHGHLMAHPLQPAWQRNGSVHRSCFDVASGSITRRGLASCFRPATPIYTYLYWNEPARTSPSDFTHFTLDIMLSTAAREDAHLLRPLVAALDQPLLGNFTAEEWTGGIAANKVSRHYQIARGDIEGISTKFEQVLALLTALDRLLLSPAPLTPIDFQV